MGYNIQKLIQTWTVTAMISAFLWLVVSVKAEVWRDEFNSEELEGWTFSGEDSSWKVKDGFLTAEIRTQFMVKYEFLQLTALRGPYENFMLTVKDIGSKGTNFGIGLTKIFPDVPGEKKFFYVFLTNRINARRFDGHNGSIPFLTRLPRNPETRWETKELKQMKLTFNTGQFQMFANGELRAEFDDSDFARIDVIGFVLVGFKEVPGVGEAWADSFTIFSPSLGVWPKCKLATTWGKMKKSPLF